MKPIIAWFGNNHVAANLLMGLIVLAGLVTLPIMPKKTFPDIDVPYISIAVPYLGAAPEEVEEGVCVRIEEELEGVVGVKSIRSNASEGVCSVSVELFEDNKGARGLAYNPEHHDRMKHVQRRHFFVRDMVESFELEVPFVPTKKNAADIFTKPMKNAGQFRALRRMVMNERD